MTRSDDSEVPDYLSLMRMDGRGLVVIGAGQGIGRQACHALAQAGAVVCCVDVDADLAGDIAAEVDGVPWSGDATVRAEAERLFAEAPVALAGKGASGLGGIVDIVGMARYRDLLDMDDETWDWHHDIVLRHAYLAVSVGGRALRDAGGGVMVFVASASGLTAAPRHAAYGAAKAGLINLTGSLAMEWAPLVRVNCIVAGMIATEAADDHYGGPEGLRAVAATVPLGRMGTPADIAGVCLFLASPLASYLSGSAVEADGGGEWPPFLAAVDSVPTRTD
jgi:NAD(P)-dependent dehydrogenase (short-subunit alcohol dehydrogenase family)